MADRDNHLDWARKHEALADQLALGDADSKRWSIVVAYYSVLHTVHAIAAESWGEHPTGHDEILAVPGRLDSTRKQLSAQVKELLTLSFNARYLDGQGAVAAQWYAPYFHDAEEAIERAQSLMRILNVELKRVAGMS